MGLLKETAQKALRDLFEDKLLFFLFPIASFMSFVVCLGWNVPFGFGVNLFYPLCVSVAMLYIMRAITNIPRAVYIGSGRTMTQQEAADGFEVQTSLDMAKKHEMYERYTEAAGLYERALALKPDELFARQSLAMIYLEKLGKPEKALHQFKLLANTAPEDSLLRGDAMDACRSIIKHTREQKAKGPETLPPT